MDCLKVSDLETRLASDTTRRTLIIPQGTAEPLASTFWPLVKDTSRPPKPKVAPTGRAIHLGAFASGFAGPMGTWLTLKSSLTTSVMPLPVHWRRLCTVTLPSNDAVVKIPGTDGDHATSKFQLPLGGSSVTMLLLSMSQQIVRLSFPLVSISEGSVRYHAMERTPLECPASSFSGETLFLKSHSCSVGERSSSDATTSCVATSGFHCSAEQRLRL
mmetsp:Transcript_27610/g.65510  ORF Transcript_27610/g.65510 Transcript_27610/m.65510 type:complete len:216 (+) Transcript_27610:188-835(+)